MATSPQDLLSEPLKEDEVFSKAFKRPSCSYESHWERFKVERRQFTQQYANMYFKRLQEMRGRVTEKAKQKWGEDQLNFGLKCTKFDLNSERCSYY